MDMGPADQLIPILEQELAGMFLFPLVSRLRPAPALSVIRSGLYDSY